MAQLLRIGEVAKAVGVSVDTLRRWERAGRVSFVRVGNQRLLPAEDLGALVAANHVKPTTSAGNELAGVVIEVECEGLMAKVEVACGPYRVVSLMSREAADGLGLGPGVEATVLIDSINVMVER